MRHTRVTWPGAFHHVMSRGAEGKKILSDSRLKSSFLEILKEVREQLRIRILAYCLMDNHYHLVLENTSGRMSDMLKRLNGRFGMAYRRENSEKGYVFQDRFKSTLIENDTYLITSIMYTLYNPVRAGLVRHYSRARWTSAVEMLREVERPLIDIDFVLDLFGDLESFIQHMDSYRGTKMLPVSRTQFGEALGSKVFERDIERRFNRRRVYDPIKRKRQDDRFFVPLGQVVQDFENRLRIKVEEIDTGNYIGKRLRSELLLRIRRHCGLSYSEIIELPIFSDVSLGTMASMYWHARKREKKEKNRDKFQ